jgi:hypothetical protein
MTANEPGEFAGTVIIKKYERLCVDIRSIESANEKILGLGLELIGAGIYQESRPDFLRAAARGCGFITYATARASAPTP